MAVQKNINDPNLNIVSTRAKETTVFTITLWLADFGRVCFPRFFTRVAATKMSAHDSQCSIRILYVSTGVFFFFCSSSHYKIFCTLNDQKRL